MELPVFLGLIVFLLLLVSAVLVLTYIKPSSKREDASGSVIPDHKVPEKGKKEVTVFEEPAYAPYATTPINGVDDYEYSMVFQNEGDNKALTKAQRDLLMSKYPMDWSTQPPSSELFQQGLAKFKEGFKSEKPMEWSEDIYKQVSGDNMIPPDTRALELQEREILATYVPKKPGELTTYDAADAKEIIKRIYAKKGQVAEYQEVKPGVFVIVQARDKNEKIVYEDDAQASGEAPATMDANPAVGENTIVVPPAAKEVQEGLDPFFTPNAKTRDGKWDYTSWTPGLERMFAPTEPRQNWY
jgi:signal peptidase I